jgi:hypothetical protein
MASKKGLTPRQVDYVFMTGLLILGVIAFWAMLDARTVQAAYALPLEQALWFILCDYLRVKAEKSYGFD